MAHASRFLALVDAARARIQETDAATVRARQMAGDRFVLVDVRESDEWARGHVPGAVYLGKGVIERGIEAAVPDAGTPLVLYCGGGFRSALAADALRQMGYTDVTSMDGGWKAWTAAGYPTDGVA